jgi:hypothetical protein
MSARDDYEFPSYPTRTQETFGSYTTNLAIADVSNAQRDALVKRISA